MPRPERALDPSAGAVEGFASELRMLRQRAGTPGYRKMATAGRYSATTLAEAAAGRRLPVLPVVLAYVQACGGDLAEWEDRWRQTARRLADERNVVGFGPPYRGLAAFGTADADRFIGRETLIGQLVDILRSRRLIVVAGASGSGKSSLLLAGLVPAAESMDWPSRVLTPGEHPVEALALAAVGEPGALIVIDQFEEAFTLCRDDTERTAFFDAVVTAAQRYRVVIGVRADFLARCAGHAGLAPALAAGTVVVGAMAPDDLQRAISEPARRAGLTVERALVTQVLADVEGQPGALALASHALLETWRQRQGTVLTLAGYRAAGGVTGAVADTAERLYAGLTRDQQLAARQVLVRLTALGEGVEDTRRRIDLDELDLPGRHEGVDEVIDAFVAARLVVVNERTAEFAHEAVITAWPRLAGWLSEDRETLRTHRQLTEAAALWRSLGRDAGALYRGARLALAEEWAAQPARRKLLTSSEVDFLDASLRAEAAERAAAVRRTRHLRRLTAALAVLLALATVLATTALWQWRDADEQRRQALSRQLATQALSVARADVAEAMRLSVAAYSIAPTVEARGALLSTASRRSFDGRLQQSALVRDVAFSPDGATLAVADMVGRVVLWDTAGRRPRTTLSGHKVAVRAVAYRPDGRLLAGTGADGTVIVWNVDTGAEAWRLRGSGGVVDSVAFAPDGATIATIDADHRIGLWNAADGTRLGELTGSGGRDAEVVFTPDGRQLISTGDDGSVAVWDVASRTRTRTFGGGPPLYTVAVSPDGALVAAGGEGREILVWDLRSGAPVATLRAHAATVSVVRFVDATTLMSAGFDALAALWDVRRGQRMTNLQGSTSSLFAAAVSRDGRMFAAGGRDRSVLVWDRSSLPLLAHADEVSGLSVSVDGTIASGDLGDLALLWPAGNRPAVPVRLAGSATAVRETAFSADGRQVAAAGEDRIVRVWDTTRPGEPGRRLAGHTDHVRSVAFQPGGRLLVSGGADGTVRLWDLSTGTEVATLDHPGIVTRVVFSRDGATMVSGAQDGTVMVWNTASRRVTARFKDDAGVLDLALHPDGRIAAIARPDGAIALWNLASRKIVSTLLGHDGPVASVAFSADGKFLASGGYDEAAVIWQTSGWRLWARLVGHGNDVLSVAWAADSRTLYSGSSDHTIIPWRVDPAAAREDVCADLPRAFPDTGAPECSRRH